MDTNEAWERGQATKGERVKVFDWGKAAKLIHAHQPTVASAGLEEDWEWTGGIIWEDGKPVPHDDTYVYLASTWATPVLKMDDDRTGPVSIDCWCWGHQGDGWNEHTYWPDEARKILRLPW